MSDKGDAGHRPARGYSRPPAAAGNLLALRHGARSPQLVRADAAALLAEVEAEDPPWLAHVDRPALEAWSFAEATCARFRAWLDEHDHLDDDGKPRAASQLLLQWERRAADQRSRMGFDPLARARLGRDTAVASAATAHGMAALLSHGRALRDAAVDRGELLADPLTAPLPLDAGEPGLRTPEGHRDRRTRRAGHPRRPRPGQWSPLGRGDHA